MAIDSDIRIPPERKIPASRPVWTDQLEGALNATKGWLDGLVSPYAVRAHRKAGGRAPDHEPTRVTRD